MELLSHRGYWITPEEKNSELALKRSFASGWGVETDLRDALGTIVVSHDPPSEGCFTLDDLLQWHAVAKSTTLALNIKADGLARSVRDELDKHAISNAFVFDMSVPDTLGYIAAGVPVFMRQSEFEPTPALLDKASGIWLDAFTSEWYGADVISGHLRHGLKVAIVSPELHRRPHLPLWENLKAWGIHRSDAVLLCTDFPQQAAEFFDA